jgi:hypothetical protein
VTGSNFSPVNTDNPDTAALGDPTATLLDPVRPVYLPLLMMPPAAANNRQALPRRRSTAARHTRSQRRA